MYLNKISILFFLLFAFSVSSAQVTIEEGTKEVTEEVSKKKKKVKKKKIKKNKERWDDRNDPKVDEENKSSSKRSEAEKLYKDLGYKRSAETYHADRAHGHYSTKELIHIADSYRLNHQTEDAEYWYSRVITESKEPIHILHYAQVLLSNKKCDDAVRWFKEYNARAKRKDKIGLKFIQDCDELNDFVDHPSVTVTNMQHMNSQYLDFAAIPLRDKIIFTSTREEGNEADVKDIWTNEFFSDLYFVNSDDPESNEGPISLEGDINNEFHDGVSTFNKSGSEMIFSRNFTKKDKNGYYHVKIVSAQQLEGKWKNVAELPINGIDFRTCHPTLSDDGRRLYFSSDRPGGFGGMDIYVTEFLGGDWNEPRNLGPTVNTAQNELFPYINESDELYFASNGHKGLGGLDIFRVLKDDKMDEKSWRSRINLGTPFNSEQDDFAYVEVDESSGYLSSDRKGGYGKDDIYKWESVMHRVEVADMQRICVIDERTGLPIPGAQIYINDDVVNAQPAGTDDLVLTLKPDDKNEYEYLIGIKSNGKDVTRQGLQEYITDRDGHVEFEAMENELYTFKVVKGGYKSVEKTLAITRDDLLGCIEIPMKKYECLQLKGVVMHKRYPHPIPYASIEVFSRCTGEIRTFKSDQQGAFDLCVDCECEYDVKASKERFSSDQEVVTTMDVKCAGDEGFVDANLALDLNLELNLDIAEPEPTPTPVTVAPPPPPVVQYVHVPYNPAPVPAPSPYENFEVGSIIELPNIFYDFDKYYIRSDASADLDKVVEWMHRFPSLKIELGSHTDSRGKNSYNKWLARKRAKSAVQYIIDKGIRKDRLIYKGYGETTPRNHCRDGVDCSEEEHQFNRRTEVKVLSFDERDVRVRHENNDPAYIDYAPAHRRSKKHH